MRILFDQGTPVPLRGFLVGHDVVTAREMGWGELKNGELLGAADGGFDLMITTDKNLRFQQKLSGRRLAIIALPTTSWPRIRRNVALVVSAVDQTKPGEFRQLEFPE